MAKPFISGTRRATVRGAAARRTAAARPASPAIAAAGPVPLRAALLWAGLAGAAWAQQAEAPGETAAAQAALPTVHVSGAQYDPDDVRPEGVTTATKTYTAPRDIPQTIDTVEVNKYKSYGINDLATMLDGQPGVSTSYDMRGEGVMVRGFDVSSGDIYRDGVREGGQVRRSTANVERVEILKGPASVLYGRGAGGGVVNLVSKQARFDAKSSITLRGGSWENVGGTLDINRVLSPNVAVRLTADREQAHSFRSGIRNKNDMVSPSILVDTRTGLRWTGQYTYDSVWRVPDRGPAYEQLPAGVSPRQGFAQPGDYVEDRLRVLRSDLSYDFNPQWSVRWLASKREARQDFDHYFLGTYCNARGRTPTGATCTNPGLLRQSYAWQQTNNKTTIHTVDLTGRFALAGMAHELLVGVEHSDEERQPRLFSTAASNGFVDPFNPVFNAVRPAQGAPSQHNLHLATAKALYAQDLISLAPQWKLLVGARYDDYDFDSLNRLTNAWRNAGGSSVSPRAGLVWQPGREHSLYASYSKSFSPFGGRGMLGVSGAQDDEPQYSRQFEAGIKSDWLQGALSTQFSAYQIDHYNIRYQPDATNQPDFWAVRGQERSRGMEFTVSGRVASAWYVRGGAGITHATVVENKANRALEGKDLRDVARRTGSLFVRYAPSGPWYGEIGVTHSGPRWANEANTSRMAGYSRWDALVGWRAAPWTVTAAVSNLFDKEYWRPGTSGLPGTPRSLLVSANYAF